MESNLINKHYTTNSSFSQLIVYAPKNNSHDVN